jgi:hypothetical protein
MKKTERGMDSGDANYRSISSLLVFLFLVQQHKGSNIQNNIFVCCFVWVWNSVANDTEEHSLRVFKSRLLGKILGPKSDELQATGNNC